MTLSRAEISQSFSQLHKVSSLSADFSRWIKLRGKTINFMLLFNCLSVFFNSYRGQHRLLKRLQFRARKFLFSLAPEESGKSWSKEAAPVCHFSKVLLNGITSLNEDCSIAKEGKITQNKQNVHIRTQLEPSSLAGNIFVHFHSEG